MGLEILREPTFRSYDGFPVLQKGELPKKSELDEIEQQLDRIIEKANRYIALLAECEKEMTKSSIPQNKWRR